MADYVNDPTLPAPPFPGSHMVIDDRYVFVSGLTASDVQDGKNVIGDIKEETRRVMRELARMLALMEISFDEVLRVDIHLADLGDIGEMDSVYAEFFDSRRYPARTCTESPRLSGGASVEITLMARRST
ncbi:RidA family protein [Halomonas sp. TRM85114]|uniref:RidA family protein n=1 Tax=Halomonas jincaotanensis TaxID=2810616 RepID=UPI001BD2A11B|nr:RidA family protein [Halomonas jincaotanensis]MBS9403276.1 RidA family protein [Halomonas jincaotanensis]